MPEEKEDLLEMIKKMVSGKDKKKKAKKNQLKPVHGFRSFQEYYKKINEISEE